MSDTISTLASKLRPYWLRDSGTGGGNVAGGGGGSAGTVGEHGIGGGLHNGTLRDDQAPQFLKADGSRALAGSLAVAAGVTIDGVDLSAHVLLPDVHHARAHVLATNTALGADHTISGAVAGYVLKATASNAARMAQLLVPELGAVGASWDVAALTATNTVGLRTPSSDVRTGALEALLKSGPAGELALNFLTVGGAMTLNGGGNVDAGPDIQFTGNALLAFESSAFVSIDSDNNVSGSVFLIGHNAATSALSELFRFTDTGEFRLTAAAPKISTAANYLSMEPATDLRFDPGSSLVKLMSGVMLQSSNYVSQLTGMRVSAAGEGDFRYLYVDELHAKAFIADLEQALAGGQIITKSVTLLAANFTVPAAGAAAFIYVKDLPSAPGMQVFQAGDIIRLRQFSRAGGGLSITNAWGAVTSPLDMGDGTQRWTFTRSAAPNAGAMTTGAVLAKDLIILDYGTSGNGFYEVNAIDGLNAMNSPYLQFVRWTGHPATGQALRLRMGQLRGVFGVDEFGLFVGTGTEDTDRYIHLSDVDTQNGIHNLPIRMFNGAINTGQWGADGQFHIGFNGISTADERDFTITTNALRIGRRLTNYPNLLYNQASGYLAFCSGAVDKIRFDDNGDSYFAGVMTIGTAGEIRQGTGTLGSNYTGFRIWRDATTGRGQIAGYNADVVQWEADTDGRLKAAAGAIVLDDDGITAQIGTALDDKKAFRFVSSSVLVAGLRASKSGADTQVEMGGYFPGLNQSMHINVLAAGAGTGNTGEANLIAQQVEASAYAKVQAYADASGERVSFLLGPAGGTEKLRVGTTAITIYVPFTQLSIDNGQIRSDNAIALLTSGALAQAVRAGSVLASSSYAHSSRVPTNGIYSLGAVAIGVTALTSGVMLDVGGQAYIRASSTIDGAWYLKTVTTASVPLATGYLPIFFDGTNLRARLPDGTLKTITWT